MTQAPAARPDLNPVPVYIGSYTKGAGGDGAGITLAHQDPASGALTLVGLAAQTTSSTFLSWHRDGRHLYAVNETENGSVTAFAVDDGGGGLVELGAQPTGGSHPCHLTVHPSGRFLLAANYGSGAITVHPIRPDGSIDPHCDLVQHQGKGPRTDRQEGPHAHQVRITPGGEHILATDLGTDSIYLYRLDPDTGQLALDGAGRAAPGAGPRHLAFGAHGAVHVADELDSTVTTYEYRSDPPSLVRRGTIASTMDHVDGENYPSEIAIDPTGRFVYVANRGRDVVTVFATSPAGLRPVADVPTGGRWPRHLALIGGHLYVANQQSHQVTCFRVDSGSGVPEPTGSALDVATPACILPAPSAQPTSATS